MQTPAPSDAPWWDEYSKNPSTANTFDFSAQSPSFLLRLRETAQEAGALYWLDKNAEVEETRSTTLLYSQSLRIAHALRYQWKVQPGQRVLICYPFGLDVVPAILGCWLANVVAVPVFPPDPSNMKKALAKLALVVNDCQANFALTTTTFIRFQQLSSLRYSWPKVQWHATNDLKLDGNERAFQAQLDKDGLPDGESLALLQYTSGSTADPKGVTITHNQLNHNFHTCCHITSVRSPRAHSRMCFWMPIYHDYGLGAVAYALGVKHTHIYLLSPITFIERPYLWPVAIAKYRIDTTAAPAFGYDLAARKFHLCPPALRKQFVPQSFSQLVHCDIAAEPIKTSTLELFTNTFSDFGFHPAAFLPTYGLAECVCYVTRYTGAIYRVSKKDPRRVACAGPIYSGSDVLIIDPETGQVVPDAVDGEIVVRSPSVLKGYWNRPELNESLFVNVLDVNGQPVPGGHFLRTGDGGFMEEGCLYINSRLKDVMIVRGKNLYASDFEEVILNASAAMRPGCLAVFAVERDGRADLGERIVCVGEVRATAHPSTYPTECANIRNAVKANTGYLLETLVLVREKTIPKTTSGKIRRIPTKDAFLKRQLGEVYRWELASREDEEQDEVDEKTRESQRAKEHEELLALANTVFESKDPSPLVGLRVQSTEDSMKTLVCRTLAFTTGQPPATNVDDSDSIFDMGLDSMTSVYFRSSLEELLGVELPADFCFVNYEVGRLCAALWEVMSAQHLKDLKDPLAAIAERKISEESINMNDYTPLMSMLGEEKHIVPTTSTSPVAEKSTMSSQAPDTVSPLRRQVTVKSSQDGPLALRPGTRAKLFTPSTPSTAHAAALKSLEISSCRLLLVALTQIVCMLVVTGIFLIGAGFVPVYIISKWAGGVFLVEELVNFRPDAHITNPYLAALFIVPLSICTFFITSILLLPLLKWIVVGRLRPGRYRLWSQMHMRWWLYQHIQKFVLSMVGPIINDTLVVPILYRALGAHIGSRTSVDAIVASCPDLLWVGDDASVHSMAMLSTHFFEPGYLRLDRVVIGHGCSVGAKAVLGCGVVMGDDAVVEKMTAVSNDTVIPSRSVWAGIPAKCKSAEITPSVFPSPYSRRVEWFKFLGTVVVLLALLSASIMPVAYFQDAVDPTSYLKSSFDSFASIVNVLICLVIQQVSFVLCTVALKWLMVGRLQPGDTFSDQGFYAQRRFVMQKCATLCESTLLLYFHGTILQVWWYRALGARIGRWSYIFNIPAVDCDLVTVGDGVLFGGHSRISCIGYTADSPLTMTVKQAEAKTTTVELTQISMDDDASASAAVTEDHQRAMRVAPGSGDSSDNNSHGSSGHDLVLKPRASECLTRQPRMRIAHALYFPSNSVLGHRSEVEAGCVLEGQVVVAPLSLVQANFVSKSMASRVMGVPARAHSSRVTLEPKEDHVLQLSTLEAFARALLQLLSLGLLGGCLVLCVLPGYRFVLFMHQHAPYWAFVLSLPIWYTSIAFLALCLLVVLKRLLVWRYQEGEYDFNSRLWWLRFWLINSFHSFCVVNFIDRHSLQATPLYTFLLRCLGANISYSAALDSLWIRDYDLINIGSGACLNLHSVPVPHDLYSLRGFRLHPLHIGAGACIGVNAVVHGHVNVAASAFLDHCARPIVGEDIQPHTVWQGSPARRWKGTTSDLSFLSPSMCVNTITMALQHKSSRLLHDAASPGEQMFSRQISFRRPVPPFEKCRSQIVNGFSTLIFDDEALLNAPVPAPSSSSSSAAAAAAVSADDHLEVKVVSNAAAELVNQCVPRRIQDHLWRAHDSGLRVVLITSRSVTFATALMNTLPFTAILAESGGVILHRYWSDSLPSVAESSTHEPSLSGEDRSQPPSARLSGPGGKVFPAFSSTFLCAQPELRQARKDVAVELSRVAQTRFPELKLRSLPDESVTMVSLSMSPGAFVTRAAAAGGQEASSCQLTLSATRDFAALAAMASERGLTVQLRGDRLDILSGGASQSVLNALQSLFCFHWQQPLESALAKESTLLVIREAREFKSLHTLFSLFPNSVEVRQQEKGVESDLAFGRPAYYLREETAAGAGEHQEISHLIEKILLNRRVIAVSR